MEGLSLFPDDFNWQTVSKLSEAARAEKKAEQMEFLKKYARVILDNLKYSASVGASYYDIYLGNDITEASKELLMRDLAKRFPHRVEFYDNERGIYIVFETDTIFLEGSSFRIVLK